MSSVQCGGLCDLGHECLMLTVLRHLQDTIFSYKVHAPFFQKKSKQLKIRVCIIHGKIQYQQFLLGKRERKSYTLSTGSRTKSWLGSLAAAIQLLNARKDLCFAKAE